jgi:hypothetical protein
VDLEDDSSVIIRCEHNSGISVRLFDRHPMEDDPDGIYYDIELQAPGLHAVIERVVAWKHDNGVDGFLGSIAASFRGWAGIRAWQSNDRDLQVEAEFTSGGHVNLTWRISPWRHATGRWDSSVTVRLEAGEQMATAAADVRSFLQAP